MVHMYARALGLCMPSVMGGIRPYAPHQPGPMKCCMPCMKCFFRDDGGTGAAKAARSATWACTSRELDGVSGRYFGQDTKELPHHPKAQDSEAQARIVAAIEAAQA